MGTTILSTTCVGERLGLNQRQVRQLIYNGELKASQLFDGCRWKILERDFLAFKKSRDDLKIGYKP